MLTDKVWNEVICYRVSEAKSHATQVYFRYANGNRSRVKMVLREKGIIVLDEVGETGGNKILTKRSFDGVAGTIKAVLQYFEIETNLDKIVWSLHSQSGGKVTYKDYDKEYENEKQQM